MAFRRRFLALVVSLLVVCLTAATAASLPQRLTDREFWRLVTEASESDGFFRSDNLLSNELGFQSVVPELARTTKPGSVYMGVGPEQNFTYIVANEAGDGVHRGRPSRQPPAAADVQGALRALGRSRGVRVAALRTKAAERPQRDIVSVPKSSRAFSTVPPSDRLFEENRRAIANLLLKKHGFRPLERRRARDRVRSQRVLPVRSGDSVFVDQQLRRLASDPTTRT